MAMCALRGVMVAGFLAAGCTGTSSSEDGGSAVAPGQDAGHQDAGAAAEDAGAGGTDASAPGDAAWETPESGPGADAGSSFVSVAGCNQGDYSTAAGAAASVSFGPFPSYSPKCLKVATGTSVTLPGSTMHPLQGMADISGVANPFRAATASTADVTQVLTAPGFYGFYCAVHGTVQGTGMAGAVWVSP